MCEELIFSDTGDRVRKKRLSKEDPQTERKFCAVHIISHESIGSLGKIKPAKSTLVHVFQKLMCLS